MRTRRTPDLDGVSVAALGKSNSQYAFWELLPFWLFCCLVRPLLVCYIDSNFGKWKTTFYSFIKSYSFHFFSFILLEFLLIRSAVRERRGCFWTDVSLSFFWNCVTPNCWTCCYYFAFLKNFLSGFSFRNIHDSQNSRGRGGGRGIYLTPLYHFHPLHRHLDISQAITAESSPLPIVSSWTWTGNLWFYCFCFYRYYIYIIKAANVYITLFITMIFFGIIFVYFVTIATIHIIHVIISTNIILPLPLLLLLSL